MHARTLSALAAALASIALFLAAGANADCPSWLQGALDDGVYPNGANGEVRAILPFDPDGAGPLAETLVMAGHFTQVQGVFAKYVAMRNPQTGKWEGMGNVAGTAGLEALAVFEGQLITSGGGDPDSTRDDNILRWTGTDWESMGGGTTTGYVHVLHVHNGVLYAGGSFTLVKQPFAQPIEHIARWDPGTQDWESLAGGVLSGSVNAIISFGTDMIVGGNFTRANGVTVDYVAKHNGSAWSPMGAGFQGGGVGALQVYLGSVYAGGNLGSSGGLTTGGFARWNGSQWVPVGTIFPGSVHSMGVHAGQLILAGNFVHMAQNIEQYNGGAYSSIGGLGSSNFTEAILSHGGLLYIGGSFTSLAGTNAQRVAQWDGISWLPLGGGVAGQVRAMTTYLGRHIIAGGFDESAEPGNPVHNIAGWNGARLHNYGTGTNGVVLSLETFKYPGIIGSYELIAGGLFTVAGGVTANRIARWNERPNVIGDNPAWQAMGAGFNNGVYALERHADLTYAGGTFTASGATTVNRIARWNETSDVWEALGTGMNGTVYALKSFGGFLYAGGSFTTAGGVSTGGLARWNGASWSSVGGFFGGNVYALEIHDGNLVMAGNFPGFGGSANISSWNGSFYVNPAPGGTFDEVYALHSFGGRLYVGGKFLNVGAGGPASYIASYGPGGWQEVEGGADDWVFALSNFGGELQAGGWFDTVLGGLVTSPRWARYSTTGAPWITQHPWFQTVPTGGMAQFMAAFQPGTNPISARWHHYDVPLSDGPQSHGSTISGATSSTLRITNVSGYDVGQYRFVVSSFCGADTSNVARLDLPGTVDVEPVAPATITAFLSAVPNPTRATSVLTFSLEKDAEVRVRVFDVAGRIVRTLPLGRVPAGRHQSPWNARSGGDGAVRPGVYFVRLEIDGRPIGTKRVAVL